MRRCEAETLIGKLVITDYVNGGLYVGELLEIIPNKPFRALVKVKGIYSYPEIYYHNSKGGFKNKVIIRKENEIVETGNGIKRYESHFLAYNESLKVALQHYLKSVEECLKKYTEEEGYYSHYIDSKENCVKLKEMILTRLNYHEVNL